MPQDKKRKRQGWTGDSERHARVGALGGNVTKQKYAGDDNTTYYQELGRRGGKANKGRQKKKAMRSTME